MQDGAPPHLHDVLRTLSNITSSRRTWRPMPPNYVVRGLPDRLIQSRVIFWLWSHLKQLVSCDQQRTLPRSGSHFMTCSSTFPRTHCGPMVEHAILRFQVVAENDGHHVEHLLL
ncbi:hypothetical protein TNCV_1390671 [Trichonephila clavipes]|nr:hypothetical protein TNCV_1390671 [Trichonephila clavipes]